ncbi:MAG: hypothetical protein H9W81_07915 [Enterococcus sp.]|nr:hypothetical protein [Enterococcus sp.]
MIATPISNEFAAALDEKFGNDTNITTMGGRRYDRIVKTHSVYGGKSVHAFVERETGKLFKASGWAAPAKGFRFDLSTEEGFRKAIEAADPYGSYLYQR